MTSSPQIALAYIDKSPASASRVLSTLQPDVAAVFVEEIPLPHAVKLVAHLYPVTAAKILQAVDAKVAASIIKDLDFDKSSAVMRQMDRAARSQLLAKLSARTRTLLEKSLSFSPLTVGAHMTTRIQTLLGTDSVATMLDRIRQSDQDHIDLVFVLNEGGNLLGVVNSAVALRHTEETPLSGILDTSCPQVSSHSKLEAISDPALWQNFAYLPVVNRQRQVIGAISRKALGSGGEVNAPPPGLGSQSMPAAMLAALATTATGLANLALAKTTGTENGSDRNER